MMLHNYNLFEEYNNYVNNVRAMCPTTGPKFTPKRKKLKGYKKKG